MSNEHKSLSLSNFFYNIEVSNYTYGFMSSKSPKPLHVQQRQIFFFQVQLRQYFLYHTEFKMVMFYGHLTYNRFFTQETNNSMTLFTSNNPDVRTMIGVNSLTNLAQIA